MTSDESTRVSQINIERIDRQVDLAPLCCSFDKLVDTVARAVGTACRPWLRIREARADVAVRLIEEELLNAQQSRAIERAEALELRRQINIEQVIQATALQLPDEASSEPIDSDWMARFLNEVQDVTSAELQQLWSRVLATELVVPRSVSKRTLTIIRDMSSAEARAVAALAQLVWSNRNGTVKFVVLPEPSRDRREDTEITYLRKFGIEFMDLISLESAGVLSSMETYELTYVLRNEVRIGKDTYKSNQKHFPTQSGVVGLVLTPAGAQLCSVCDCDPNREYVTESIAFVKSRGIYIEAVLPSSD